MSTSEADWLTAGPNVFINFGERTETGMLLPVTEAVRFVEEPETTIHPDFSRTSDYPPVWHEGRRGRLSSTLEGRVALKGALDGAYYQYDYSVNLPGDFKRFIGKLIRKEPQARLHKTISYMMPMMKSFGQITPQDFEEPGRTLVD